MAGCQDVHLCSEQTMNNQEKRHTSPNPTTHEDSQKHISHTHLPKGRPTDMHRQLALVSIMVKSLAKTYNMMDERLMHTCGLTWMTTWQMSQTCVNVNMCIPSYNKPRTLNMTDTRL